MGHDFIHKFLLLAAGCCLSASVSSAQQVVDDLLQRYEFAAAADSAASAGLEAERVMAENGLSMMNFCSSPTVVGSHTFSLDEFFLFMPMDSGWRTLPNPLDSLAADDLVRAMYFPEDADTVYFTHRDTLGRRLLSETHSLQDGSWSTPEILPGRLNDSADAIYPTMSRDGQSLYFAARGLYGIGGYDLYKSQRNPHSGEWGTPVNMGFPYSSPADDFLWVDSEDGRYSAFASNRACGADSVTVYVIEYETMPVHAPVSDAQALRELSELRPQGAGTSGSNISSVTDPLEGDENTRLYMQKMNTLRDLRDSLSLAIASGEMDLSEIQQRVNVASAELQKVELEFLLKGIIIDPEALQGDADREVVGGSTGYIFKRKELSEPLNIQVQTPSETSLPWYEIASDILSEVIADMRFTIEE